MLIHRSHAPNELTEYDWLSAQQFEEIIRFYFPRFILFNLKKRAFIKIELLKPFIYWLFLGHRKIFTMMLIRKGIYLFIKAIDLIMILSITKITLFCSFSTEDFCFSLFSTVFRKFTLKKIVKTLSLLLGVRKIIWKRKIINFF